MVIVADAAEAVRKPVMSFMARQARWTGTAIGIAVAAGGLLGCGSAPSHIAPPLELQEQAVPPGYERIRFWADQPPDGFLASATQRSELLKRRFAHEIASGQPISMSFLALSGGAADGAFGAGLLNGWSQHGTRPEFEVVTGISTGALIAPFAFLGHGWDDQLKEVYTTMKTDRLLASNIIEGLTGGPALADAAPFRETIEQYATAEMLQQIAAEYRKGRQLFVGTTALDSGRPVAWNIGAIANSGAPGALGLFHDILQASASIPGAFPPVLIDVEVDGEPYTELHVDGGVTSQIFAYPAQFDLREYDKLLPVEVDRSLYVIRNTTVRPPYADVSPRLFSLLQRSIAVLIASQGTGDLYRIATKAERDGIAFHLASVPDTWDMESDEPFDPNYMKALFGLGERLGREGYAWQGWPPFSNAVAKANPASTIPQSE